MERCFFEAFSSYNSAKMLEEPRYGYKVRPYAR